MLDAAEHRKGACPVHSFAVLLSAAVIASSCSEAASRDEQSDDRAAEIRLSEATAMIEGGSATITDYVARATALLNLGRPKDALAESRELIAREPGEVHGYLIEMGALRLLGREEQAIGACGRAITAGVCDARLFVLRSELFESLGRREEARRDDRIVLEVFGVLATLPTERSDLENRVRELRSDPRPRDVYSRIVEIVAQSTLRDESVVSEANSERVFASISESDPELAVLARHLVMKNRGH